MLDKKKYYENTINKKPYKLLLDFLEMNKNFNNAIDLGCGAGRDTIKLIRNGYNVIAIDKENTKDMIEEQLNEEEKTRFKFVQGRFEDINFNKTDIIVSSFALSFCDRNKFDKLWNKIYEAINENGYFIGNIFGINDEWNNDKNNMTFLSRKELDEKFLNRFETIKLEELEYDGKTAMEKVKHWHFFNIMAKK